jgi:hypothetical protein
LIGFPLQATYQVPQVFLTTRSVDSNSDMACLPSIVLSNLPPRRQALTIFGRVCQENGIEHRLTKALSPLEQRSGRVDGSHHQGSDGQILLLCVNYRTAPTSGDWLVAYNFAKQLKARRFKTPYEAIEQVWKSKPEVFIVEPHHHMLGLNTWQLAFRPLPKS